MSKAVGRHDITIDSKGRFLLPVAFRNALSDDNRELFYLNKGLGKRLTFRTKESFENEEKKLEKYDDDLDKTGQDFLSRFYGSVSEVSPDAAQRITVPKKLLEYAGITKNAVFVVQPKKVEIWDEDTFEKYMAELDAQFT